MLIAHVVRDYGNLTEPFIDERIASSPTRTIWFERGRRKPPPPARLVRPWPWFGGGALNRLFHRFPHLGAVTGRNYAAAERADRPEVIHAHYLTTAAMIGRHTSSPLVVSAYGFDVSVMPRRLLWRHIYSRLASRVARVLVEGPHMAERVAALGFDRSTIDLVPIAVNTESVVYREPHASLDRPLRFVSCGRLVEKKGHDTAMEAFARLREDVAAGSTLDIVGDGPLHRGLVEHAASLGITQTVKFHGGLPRNAYLELLKSCDVLIAASRTASNGDSEGGAPTTILDAQASGVLVVASNHADLPYLVEDGVTGFRGSGEGVSSITGACERAIALMRMWPAIADRARRQVETRHSPEALGHRLAEVYGAVTRS